MLLCVLVLTGCAGRITKRQPVLRGGIISTADEKTDLFMIKKAADIMAESTEPEAEIIETDWAAYFEGLNGAAVFYDAAQGQYRIYNEELAAVRRSPCSTFKIISSLIAMENGIIEPADSTRAWSGEIFWNEKWNTDLAFEQAFRESCVWYFREVIDEIGQELMEEELHRLQYGNCDISDWEGRLNTNNNNRALTGFWIESSLAISPKEQTEVMERIFGEDSVYAGQTKEELKQVMAVTGPDDRNVSSTVAKEIAVQICREIG